MLEVLVEFVNENESSTNTIFKVPLSSTPRDFFDLLNNTNIIVNKSIIYRI